MDVVRLWALAIRVVIAISGGVVVEAAHELKHRLQQRLWNSALRYKQKAFFPKQYSGRL